MCVSACQVLPRLLKLPRVVAFFLVSLSETLDSARGRTHDTKTSFYLLKHNMSRLSVVPADAAPPITDAVDLSLRLIEKLALAAEPQGVSDLARELGSSKATVYRHMQKLAVHGFARQDATSSR